MNDILSKIAVSLLVRLRVEITQRIIALRQRIVSLLVRLRVEMLIGHMYLIRVISSASS